MCLYVSAPLDKLSLPNTLSYVAPSAPSAELYRTDYHAAVDYNLPAGAVPNSIYAVNGPHPSELVVGKVEPSASYPMVELAYLDSALPVAGSLKMLPTVKTDVEFIGDATQTHHYALGTCENFGACPPGALVGDKCSATIRGAVANGYCYTSEAGSLECGRLLQAHSRLSGAEVNLPYPNGAAPFTPSRCPAGFPLDRTGTATAKMLLIGGCMIGADSSYLPSAMIHVPELCSTPTDYPGVGMIGCLFPGALNYAPGAVQSGPCEYKTTGCTSPTALNYNSEATEDDLSCIMPVAGCTIHNSANSYVDGAPTTPMYQGRFVGSALRNVGEVVLPTYGAVTNFNPSANVNSGCVIALEGCMNPAAVNYNSKATVNSNTWCIMPVSGCMMPSPETVSTGALTNNKDGGAANFNVAATVNVVANCVVGRKGCPNPAAHNYDAHATIDDGSCYTAVVGCLDPSAMNFNCSSLDSFVRCSYTDRTDVPIIHDVGACNYAYSPPPAARPGIPAGYPTREVKEYKIDATGTVSDYTDAIKDQIAQTFATTTGAAFDMIRVLVTAGSVVITVEIETTPTVSAAVIEAALATHMATADSATAFINQGFPLPIIQVLSTPTSTTAIVVDVMPPTPPPSPEEDNDGAIVGGIVGGFFAIGLCIGVFCYLKKKRDKKKRATYPA